MRKFVAIFLILAMVTTGFLSGCSKKAEPQDSGEMLVMASIPPLGDFAREVGRGRVRVKVLVPPGASPHTYELKPSQLKDLRHARVLVLVGLGLEFWADKAISAANNPNLIVVKTSEGLQILQGDNGRGNPHVWLDPINAIHMVKLIRDAFIKADPEGKEVYQENTERYIEQLKDLDQEIRVTVSHFSSRKYVAFHPAWAYFAKRYGLQRVAVIEPIPGKEPSPSEILKMVKEIKAAGAGAIFAEPQTSSKVAQVISVETGIKLVVLDPLGGVPGRETYIDLMRYNLSQMEKALK